MLAFLFSCCGRRHRPHESLDEHAPLIPHSHDSPSHVSTSPPPPSRSPSLSPQPRLIDNQSLKDRLGSVVRAKEGKMVNVNAHFPFNLHPDSSSRSSRNVSGGTLPSSRAASPSPAHQLQKCPSTASFRPDTEDVSHYLPLLVSPSVPILNIRLVKSIHSIQNTRGRSQRSADTNGRAQSLDAELAPHEHHSPSLLPVYPEAPPHPEDFSIHDAGAVARSWGD